MVKHWFMAAGMTGMILAGPAFGHARLRSSQPAADAQLPLAPQSLTLTFSENVRLAVLSLAAGPKEIPVALDRNAPAAATVSVALPALAAGRYPVKWSALSADDGHVTKGSFAFTVVGTAAIH
jgi:methionine-rich copper-binding protein CopC